MTYLATLDLPLERLTTYPGNPRRGNLPVVEESLRRNDQYRAIVVQATDPTNPAAGGTILAGNHTFMAASKIGMPTIRAELHHVDDDTAKRIVAVDNRAADLGNYDDRLLAELLTPLDDLAGTGYHNDDLAALVASLDPDDPPEDDDLPAPRGHTDGWTLLAVRVPPQIIEAWKAHLDTHTGDQVAAMAALLGIDHADLDL